MAIDFGTYSTSCSFSRSDHDYKDIQTVTDWPKTNLRSFGGRVTSSILYKNEDEPPLWGGDADKMYHNESSDFFFAPHLKLYLTDRDNQPPLPEDKLTPVKIISDYLKALHKHCIAKMKEYYDTQNLINETETLVIADREDSIEENDSKVTYSFDEDQVRYIFSYPDNQEDDGASYREQITEAVINAGIISANDLSANDYESRLSFLTDSGATAYHCSALNYLLKPSIRPYLVCDVGGKVFGLSTIMARELPETGEVSSSIEQSDVGCGNLELDNKMRSFLATKVTSSSDDDKEALKMIHDRLFEEYIDRIKLSFDGSDAPIYYSMNQIVLAPSIEMSCIEDGNFVFDPEELKEHVFNPVTDRILDRIDAAIKAVNKKHGTGVSGIFLSGTIGQDDYLKNLVDERFGKDVSKVMSLKNNEFAVSKGLVQYGLRQHGLMIPYLIQKDIKKKDRIISLGNNSPESVKKFFQGVKKINHQGLDYFIGLDFGTTYSGFAYAAVPKAGEPAKDHTKEIEEIKEWPRADNRYPKAPSVLFYDEAMNYKKKFGYQAKHESMRKNGVLLTKFKLLLSRKFDHEVDDGLLKKLNENTTVEAITNYLRDFAKVGIERMEKKLGKSVDKSRLGYVVTVPAMWSDEAKNTMAVAVRRANIVKLKDNEKLDDRVIFITEAEAAALYCQVFFSDKFTMGKNQRFMICDCGGGTVDLVTFQVGQEEGENGKLLISELTSGDGDNYGSVYLDENFRNYLVEKLQKQAIRYNESGIQAILDIFIRDIKPEFNPAVDSDKEEDIRIPIPVAFGIPPGFEDGTGFIEEDVIVIPYAVMEKEVFIPIIDQIIKLVDKQLRKLPENERQLDAILMVGGFGRSPYLHRKLKDTFEGRKIGANFIGMPPDGDLAICRGAVSFGLDPRMVAEGITRYTYGLQVKDKAKQGDNPSQKFTGDDGQEYSRSVFTEIVEKEHKINKGDIYAIKTFVTYPHDPIFAIYSSDEEQNNDKRNLIDSDLEPIYKLTVNIRKISGLENAKVGDKIELEVLVVITGTSIEVNVLHGNEIVTNGITKVPAIVKRKFTKGTSAEPTKRKITLFSLIKNF
ncbi:hypothetical protein K501DRAFT_282533 [Backusella circina FSU 941]|nr:hypothetical protein K501DRAFT_282533 [Backusella circina FSU 941]